MRRPSSIEAGLRCRCPECGEGKLFSGFLTIADKCDRCGLDFSFADPADGPAFFSMTGIGILVITAWAWSTVVYNPPLWFQFITVFPALIIGCLGTLRPIKAWLVAEQHLHKAGTGTIASIGAHGEGGFGLRHRAKDKDEA